MININGKVFYGNNISISKNKIIVDGVEVTDKDIVNTKTVNITVEGNVNSIEADYVTKLDIKRNVNNVNTVSGDVYCENVTGDIKTTSGDVDISGYVNGSVQTTSGDVSCGPVEGNVKTMSGKIKHK